MVGGLHIHIQNRTMKPLAIALVGQERVCVWGGDVGTNFTNVQYKTI
jgi:hypothetical protein